MGIPKGAGFWERPIGPSSLQGCIRGVDSGSVTHRPMSKNFWKKSVGRPPPPLFWEGGVDSAGL